MKIVAVVFLSDILIFLSLLFPAPTSAPTSAPTPLPSPQPSPQPSSQPSEQPSLQPSLQPSSAPSCGVGSYSSRGGSCVGCGHVGVHAYTIHVQIFPFLKR